MLNNFVILTYHCGLVDRNPLRLMRLQVVRYLGVATKILNVLQFALRVRHRFTQQGEGLQCGIQSITSQYQAVFQQNLVTTQVLYINDLRLISV